MTVTRGVIPRAARSRRCTAWRLTIGKVLSEDETKVVAQRFLAGTEHHALLQAYTGFGTTIIEGDYWGTRGRAKDLSQVANRWDEVEAEFPELIVDAALDHRVPPALVDAVEVYIGPDADNVELDG